jgi:hypothetical protein
MDLGLPRRRQDFNFTPLPELTEEAGESLHPLVNLASGAQNEHVPS